MRIWETIKKNKSLLAWSTVFALFLGYVANGIFRDDINQSSAKLQEESKIIEYNIKTEEKVISIWKEYHLLPANIDLYNERINFLEEEAEKKRSSKELSRAINETYNEMSTLKESYKKIEIMKKEKKNLDTKIDSLNNKKILWFMK